MVSGINPSVSDEVNRQSSVMAKHHEQLRRWDESATNRESPNIKLSQRVKFEQAYIFLAVCLSEDRDEIDVLSQSTVDINISNIDDLIVLYQTCIDNNLHMVEYLLNKNTDINCQDNEEWTLYMLLHLVEILIFSNIFYLVVQSLMFVITKVN